MKLLLVPRWRAILFAIGLPLVAVILWLSLTPEPPQIDVQQGDKLSHVLAYAALMFWFAQIYRRRRERIGCAIGFVAMGIAIEFAQRATGYRSYEVLDMVANTVGVALGWIVAAIDGGRLLARIQALLARPPG